MVIKIYINNKPECENSDVFCFKKSELINLLKRINDNFITYSKFKNPINHEEITAETNFNKLAELVNCCLINGYGLDFIDSEMLKYFSLEQSHPCAEIFINYYQDLNINNIENKIPPHVLYEEKLSKSAQKSLPDDKYKEIREKWENVYSLYIKQFKNPGYVYLLKTNIDCDYYKIGLTKNPNKRYKQISPKMPFELEKVHLIKTNCRYKLEELLHEKYKNKRIKGEWFKLNNKDVEFIKKLKNVKEKDICQLEGDINNG